MNLYLNPVGFGVQDVTVLAHGRPMRIVFPSESPSVHDASILAGTYPLVVFLHGDRHAPEFSYLCPSDVREDYKAWGQVLYLLASGGFVVAIPEVGSTYGEAAADVIEEVIGWMQYEWKDRSTLWYDAFALASRQAPASLEAGALEQPQEAAFAEVAQMAIRPDQPIPPGGISTPVGVAGHSWGVRGCSLYAARPGSGISALASIAGIVDDDVDAYPALIGLRIPTLTMIGSKDDVRDNLNLFWPFLEGPKHQAVVNGTDHFDWFGSHGYIHRCDGGRSGTCPIAGATAAELVLTFMTKYLKNVWTLPPSLVGPRGNRQPVIGAYGEFAGCGLDVRWRAPMTPGGIPQSGQQRWGNLPDFSGWDSL